MRFSARRIPSAVGVGVVAAVLAFLGWQDAVAAVLAGVSIGAVYLFMPPSR